MCLRIRRRHNGHRRAETRLRGGGILRTEDNEINQQIASSYSKAGATVTVAITDTSGEIATSKAPPFA